MFKTNLLLFLVVCLSLCDAYKILVVFPMAGKSHTILGEGFVKHLLQAGHEVTYITPIPVKPQKNLRQIDVSTNFPIALKVLDNALNLTNILEVGNKIKPPLVLNLMFSIANNTILHQDVQNLIHDPKESFDAVIAEWLFTGLYSGFAAVFNCPLIWSSSMEPHGMVLELIHEAPNPAYSSNSMAVIEPPYTFTQRVAELGDFLFTNYLKWSLKPLHEKTFSNAFKSAVEKRGRELPKLEVIKYNASVMFGNSHFSFGQAISLPQNYIPIVGYHIEKEVKPLPKELKKIMDESTNGVIFFSMGTMLKSSTWPENLKRDMLKLFAGLKQTVIWKFEEVVQDLPKNVHILQWAPQQSILAHPNCVLFITHGGLLSITEALHFGVPIIGIPMFADQYVNVHRAINRGFALKVGVSYNIPEDLEKAIHEILGNPKYTEKIKQLSSIYHDRPQSPGDSLVYWTEYVIRTRGAPHLRSPALFNTWYEKMYLDLLGLILVTIIILRVVVKKLLAPKKGEKLKRS